MTISKKLLTVGLVTSTLGVAGLAPSAYYWHRNRQLTEVAAAADAGQSTVTKPTVVQKPKVITGKPVRVLVPSLGIDLAVIDGVYDRQTHQWSISTDKAHYALMTVQPNSHEGNTMIYGHYRPEVFAYLHNIQPGAEVKVMTANGLTFTYKYRSSKAVNPADTSIFAYEGKPKLTIQTCSGAFMQNRQLYTFDLTNIQNKAHKSVNRG